MAMRSSDEPEAHQGSKAPGIESGGGVDTVITALGSAYGPLASVSALALLVAAVLGSLWLAVAALAVALVAEVTATYVGPAIRATVDAAGLPATARGTLRSMLVLVAVGGATDGVATPLIAFALAAVGAHVAGILSNTLLGWVLGRAPVLGARNVAVPSDVAVVIARIQRHRARSRYAFTALEWLVLLGIAIGVSASEPTGVSIIAAATGLGLMAALALTMLHRARDFVSSGRIPAYEDALVDELTALAPDVLVYLSAAAGQAGYMLNQWLPPLSAMDRRGMIVVREASNVAVIGDTSLPVIQARDARQLERMVLPSIKAAFYVANAGRNVQLLREPLIRHAFLNHGDSDKATSANPVARVYDEVWVAGEAAIDRYEAAGVSIPREKFAIIGRPQVHGLPVGPRSGRSPPRVLYAPTWEGIYEEVNYSSLEVGGVAIIRTILAEMPDVDIIFKPHPSSGEWRPEMRIARREVERLLIEDARADRHMIADQHSGMTLFDCFRLADVLVSDVSSVVTDFLHTERPIITSNPIGLTPEEYFTMFPTQRSSYVFGPDWSEAADALRTAFEGDPLAEERSAMKRYVLGDLPDGPVKAFSDNVDRICDDAVAHIAQVRNSFMFDPPAVAHNRSTNRPSLVAALRHRHEISLRAHPR